MATTYSNQDYYATTSYDSYATTPMSDADAAVFAGMFGVFMVVYFVFLAAFYVYMALALSAIAKKTNTANPWLAWIPVANIVLLLNIAKKPVWWILLLIVPIANLIVSIIAWMAVAEARHKPNWWGVLMLVPGVNVVVPGYLAWSK